jgi:hypothetical protein
VADLTAALEIARRGAGTSEEAATNVANLLAKINSPTVTRAFAKNFGVDLPAALKAAYAPGQDPDGGLAAITQRPPAATCRSWAWWSRTCRPSRPCAP